VRVDKQKSELMRGELGQLGRRHMVGDGRSEGHSVCMPYKAVSEYVTVPTRRTRTSVLDYGINSRIEG